MKQIPFFALPEDLLRILDSVERGVPLKYFRTGNFTEPNLKDYRRAGDIPDLGKADSPTGSTCQSFLVTPASLSIRVRAIRSAEGSDRYCVDQLLNPDTVELTPAGIWGGDMVLNGRVATTSESAISQDLMKRFNSVIRREFEKVKAFWVGPGAYQLLQQGQRLALSAQSSRDFDLSMC